MNNYIDHETKVRVIDNILEKNDNWDFFVKYINENYDLIDISSWRSFLNTSKRINFGLYGLFIRISSYTNYDLNFDNNIFNDVYLITKFEIPKRIFVDNFNHVFHGSSEEFINEYKPVLYNANAFSYANCQLDYGTWQEYYLLDMININFQKKEIQPLISTGDGYGNPDITKWSKNILEELKSYFSSKVSDFVIETIGYLLHNNEMSKEVKNTHVEMLLEYSKNSTNMEIINSSSFKIISDLFKDKMMKDFSNSSVSYRALLELIHSETDIEMLDNLKKCSYPISKEQNIQLKNYYRTKYEKLDNIEQSELLLLYLKDADIVKEINEEYFGKLKTKFREVVKENYSIEISSLFMEYMEFLFKLSDNQNIEKQSVQLEIIDLQRLWQEIHYMKQVLNLHEIRQQLEVPIVEKDAMNEQLLNEPVGFISLNFSTQDVNLVDILQTISSTPLLYMINRTSINYQFPQKSEIDVKTNSVDGLILKKIKNILHEKGYKFLNILDKEEYLLGIHEQFKIKAQFILSLIDIDKLYNKVPTTSGYELIEYQENLLVAHLTQLFPLLEIKIRTLSGIIGISPYKNNMSDFMKYKDPSSLLKKMIEMVYRESGSFENVPDLLFIYNAMYNSNSLNIRNESVHGREYLMGNSLSFAIIVTLISILAIDSRIIQLRMK